MNIIRFKEIHELFGIDYLLREITERISPKIGVILMGKTADSNKNNR
ncbi:MAG: hypothetical protein HXS54_17140 [Theionarchaea archaeon]|nr:hypothetical protein [Theionarchaea archaeon]